MRRSPFVENVIARSFHVERVCSCTLNAAVGRTRERSILNRSRLCVGTHQRRFAKLTFGFNVSQKVERIFQYRTFVASFRVYFGQSKQVRFVRFVKQIFEFTQNLIKLITSLFLVLIANFPEFRSISGSIGKGKTQKMVTNLNRSDKKLED